MAQIMKIDLHGKNSGTACPFYEKRLDFELDKNGQKCMKHF